MKEYGVMFKGLFCRGCKPRYGQTAASVRFSLLRETSEARTKEPKIKSICDKVGLSVKLVYAPFGLDRCDEKRGREWGLTFGSFCDIIKMELHINPSFSLTD